MSENAQDATNGVLRMWSEMFGLWLDFLGSFAPLGAQPRRDPSQGWDTPWSPPWDPRNAGSAAGPFQSPFAGPFPSPTPPQSEWMRVTFDVTAPKRVEVTLDLAPDADIAALVVQDLTALDAGGKPPITGAKLERVEKRVVVRMSVSPSQPPGTYLGMIIDPARTEQRGGLRVVVWP